MVYISNKYHPSTSTTISTVYPTMNNEMSMVVCSLTLLGGVSFIISRLGNAVKPTSNPECDLYSTIECEPNPPRYDETKSYSRFSSNPTLYRVASRRGIPRYVYSYVDRCYVTNDDYQYDMGF